MAPRILIVDDDPAIVRLLRSYLERAGLTVLTASDGEAALHAIRRERPELVVLDLMLPGRDGWDITRRVREDEHLAGLPILMLTARVEDQDKIVGLELGADDYVTKPFNPSEVVARVRALLRRAGEGPRRPHVLRAHHLRMDLDRHQVEAGGRTLELTPTEFSLLQSLLEAPGHAYTRAELIERALGYNYEGLERTLDSHIKNLRRKIDAGPPETSLIETVLRVGYRLRPEEGSPA
jgi:two-component system alkaline phosphatase synthesis response regulator PhoP